jgi:glucose-6-phosphate 1-dehydrogenase
MLQNHHRQLLCLVAVEPPISVGERDLRDRRSTSCAPFVR